jgi:hypothetical protein
MRNLMKVASAIFLFLLLFPKIAEAQTITINPTNQEGMNKAIQAATQDGIGIVYLNSGVYEITNTVNLKSNLILTGSPDAIIRVSSSSSQWFSGTTGILSSNGPVNNVQISNIQIDGNCENLPHSYNSNDQDPHDCERGIIFNGYTNQFGNNITIKNMKVYDTFSDGIHVRFSNNVHVLNCMFSDCQHEGVYFCEVMQGEISGCDVAGITSDCLRVENCHNVTIHNNILYSYNGTHSNGAYQGGENGIQLGNQGRSFGVGSPKPDSIKDIEVYDNVFANNGLKAIQADAVALEQQANVYIHDNKFLGSDELQTMGIPVELSNNSIPTIQESERIFSSIFDILNIKFSENAVDGGNSYTPDIKKETKGKISAGVDIVGFRNMIEEDSKYYIKNLDDVIVVSEADNLASLPVSTDKEVSLSENSNTITADLKVKIRYKTASSYQSRINGIPVIKIKYTEHSETEHFFTSVDAPTIYNISATPDVTVTILNNSYNPQSRYYVPATPWTTKISFEYNNSTSWHFLKVGEVKNNSKNVEYVSLKDSEYWNKSDYIGTIHNIFVIPIALDPYKADQVKVTLYDCYGNVQNVTDYKVTVYNEDLTKFTNPFAYLFLGLISILLSGMYVIFKGVIFKRRM